MKKSPDTAATFLSKQIHILPLFTYLFTFSHSFVMTSKSWSKSILIQTVHMAHNLAKCCIFVC